MMKPWHEMKCSLHIFRELVPAKCQNLFGKLESQSTGELTGENFNYIQFREGTIFWYTAYLKKIQNFLLKMLWFGSSHFTKAVLSPQLVPFTFSFGPGRRVGCRPQWVITDYAVVPSVPGDLLPLGCQQNAEALTSCAEHMSYHTGRSMWDTCIGQMVITSNFQLCAQLHLLPRLLPIWIQECLQAMELNTCFSRMFSLLEEYLEHHCSRQKVGGILETCRK